MIRTVLFSNARTRLPLPGVAAFYRALANQVVQAGSELVLADDSLTMARHAARRGWISEATLPEIKAEQARDEAR
jgi:hypothetical protein